MSTDTLALDANNSVTPINQKPLRDALGTVLEVNMRVEHVRTGERAIVRRLDLRSRRAVIEFEKVDGQPVKNDTMRQAHLLKVRVNNKKVPMFTKPLVKSTKTAKVKAAVEAAKA